MSQPSSMKNGNGAHPVPAPPPRQIRFVSTDGQPQTKRRRVNAACRTCRRRKIRCSGEQPVCKTCTDYNHTCLGYSDPPTHVRSQSDGGSRRPALSSLPSSTEAINPENIRAVESQSPDPPRRPNGPSNKRRASEISKSTTSLKSAFSYKDPSSRTAKDVEQQQQAAGDTPGSNRSSVSANFRAQVPYFRYFGPTAIVPGFKQMFVEIRGSRKSNPSSPALSSSPSGSPKSAAARLNTMSAISDSSRDDNKVPFYDTNDTSPVSNLVTHLCELFFEHLGCNFPFLQRDSFLRDVKDKKLNMMLVNVVCALSARFSPHPLLDPPQSLTIDGYVEPHDWKMSDRGHPFACRARGALVDSLSCPTLSVAQACLLLAYEEFGSNRDSGLWMYLGISIRMAQDLGIQKRRGPHRPTNESISEELGDDDHEDPELSHSPEGSVQDTEDSKREREDTFWCIFFLDRVISSGTGRPVTLVDEDIQLCFPAQSESVASNGWPAPFPPLIRIIHLYGRATDIINGIQDVNDVTEDTVKRLAGLESDLTGIYSALSSKLYFDAANLQQYAMAKEGTSFILLHLWFHALIVLLHQPTLLHSFGGTIQQLYPNSRPLAMSSAKTIADISSFSELMDSKSFVRNPFTSQPMYIAACAFLMESAYYASPDSKSGISPQPLLANQSSGFVMPRVGLASGSEQRSIGATQHHLLAKSAKDNYQKCYKALKALEVYWEGTKYILTVLDQKAKGIVDPLLYTAEEVGDAPVQPLTTRKRQRSKSPSHAALNSDSQATPSVAPLTEGRLPRLDPSQAIGWALTNAADPHNNPNLSVLYQNPAAHANSAPNRPPYSPQYSHSHSGTGQSSNSHSQSVESPRHIHTTRSPPILSVHGISASEASPYIGLNAPYPNPDSHNASGHPLSTYNQSLPPSQLGTAAPEFHYQIPSGPNNHEPGDSHMGLRTDDYYHPGFHPSANDVLIESQNIDMNMLHDPGNLPFLNGDGLAWLEYLPPDVASLFGEHPHYPS